MRTENLDTVFLDAEGLATGSSGRKGLERVLIPVWPLVPAVCSGGLSSGLITQKCSAPSLFPTS